MIASLLIANRGEIAWPFIRTARATHRRHPELVSGSIVTRRLRDRGKTQTDRQIVPMQVFGFDQVDFPVAVPVLQLFLAGNRRRHIGEELVADEAVDGVTRRKAFDCARAVLVKTRDKFLCHADVKGAVMFAGEDVDTGLFWHRISQFEAVVLASRWTLKQVQGDGRGQQDR